MAAVPALLQSTAAPQTFALLINCTSTDVPNHEGLASQYLHLPVPVGDKHRLERSLQRLLAAINDHLPHGPVCIACDTGTNVSACVCVAALVLLFTPEHVFVPVESVGPETVQAAGGTKARIKHCQMYVASSVPNACPDRNLTKQVNRFFLTSATHGAVNFAGAPAPVCPS